MDSSLFSLYGKIAVVTGGKHGIGKAIALALAQAGADVVVCSRVIEDGKLKAVADEIKMLGRRSLAVQTDITRRADVDNLIQKVLDEFGRIDILVNNAGVLIQSPLLELSEEDWDKTIDTDLKGYYFCCQAVGIRMVEQKSGNIINIASGLATKALPLHGVYCAAKAGVLMITKVLARELAQYNIRVNAISPAMIKTTMTKKDWGDSEFLDQYEAATPLGRIGETSDIAGAAVFLSSDASSYITGHSILVDGGFYA
ncbi:SDR family NAD(P)-dependent oxidoreductase [Chloroflexota bacterium]